jgi:hypothetical protein
MSRTQRALQGWGQELLPQSWPQQEPQELRGEHHCIGCLVRPATGSGLCVRCTVEACYEHGFDSRGN